MGIALCFQKQDDTYTEVTDEFGFSGQVTHDRGFQDSNEEKELDKATGGDFLEGGKTVGDFGEGLAGVVDGSGETDTGFLDEVANNGEHWKATRRVSPRSA